MVNFDNSTPLNEQIEKAFQEIEKEAAEAQKIGNAEGSVAYNKFFRDRGYLEYFHLLMLTQTLLRSENAIMKDLNSISDDLKKWREGDLLTLDVEQNPVSYELFGTFKCKTPEIVMEIKKMEEDIKSKFPYWSSITIELMDKPNE